MELFTRSSRLLSAVVASALIMSACTGSASTDSGAVAGNDTVAIDAGSEGELAAGGEATAENQTSHLDADDLAYDESDIVAISLDGATATTAGDSVEIDGSEVTITGGGSYALSGTLDDGQVVVDAGDDDDVVLILDGVDIVNGDGAAIAVLNADEAVVVLAEGSSNRLTDGSEYVFPDSDTDEPNATLYSAADLAIAGEGELIVTANYNDGIASKDGLVIDAGTIAVTAVDDGIRGKDYVIVEGGAITIEAMGDGIKSDNDEDTDRGYVLVADGSVTIDAGDDAIQAATDILITGGTLDVEAGGTSGSGRALQGDVMVSITGGEVQAVAADDAIHSNEAVIIDGGTLTLAAGDDGIHGDYTVMIDSGAVTIVDSFEGIEAEVITINGGTIDITSNDDGLNVASAEASAATEVAAGGGRGGGPGGGVEEVGEHYIYINGGSVSITVTDALAEQGDGIDANGHIVMTGGVVSVSGATDTRNSAIDYSGGSFTMSGGLIIGTNVDGRNSEGVGVGSTQASLYIVTGSTLPAGTVVHIESSDGSGLVTFEPANDYSVIVFSSSDLVAGESYDVYVGGTVSGGSASGLYDVSEGVDGELIGSVAATL